MKNSQLAIYGRDEKYLEKLQQNLVNKDSFPFSVSIFRNMEELKIANEKNPFEILLMEEEIFKEIDKEIFSGMVILLQEKGIIGEKADGAIHKYQSAEAIRKKLLELYADWNGSIKEHGQRQREVRLIGVYSPLGRSIQTLFSLFLGEFLAKNKSVLYLNFEPFSGLSGLLGREEEKDLTDLVYYLENGKDRFLYKLESLVSNINGLNYVAPAYSYMDIAAVKAEDWLLLIRSLQECGTYDAVILDLSELVQGLPEILRECSYIYTLHQEDGLAAHKMKEYENLMERQDFQDVISKTKKVELPAFHSLPSTLEEMDYSELAEHVRKIVCQD